MRVHHVRAGCTQRQEQNAQRKGRRASEKMMGNYQVCSESSLCADSGYIESSVIKSQEMRGGCITEGLPVYPQMV